MLNCLDSLKGETSVFSRTQVKFLNVITAAGVVPCGVPKNRPVHYP